MHQIISPYSRWSNTKSNQLTWDRARARPWTLSKTAHTTAIPLLKFRPAWMTTSEYSKASSIALEASYPSSSATPTINTPSSSPSYVSRSPQRRDSPPLSREPSRHRASSRPPSSLTNTGLSTAEQGHVSDSDLDEEEMTDARPPFHRPTDGRSQIPLLKDEHGRPSYDSPDGSMRPAIAARHSTFRSRSPDAEGSTSVKKRYTYAAFFLVVSLISFVVQTETAVYIQKDLGWHKPYAML